MEPISTQETRQIFVFFFKVNVVCNDVSPMFHANKFF